MVLIGHTPEAVWLHHVWPQSKRIVADEKVRHVLDVVRKMLRVRESNATILSAFPQFGVWASDADPAPPTSAQINL